MPTTQATGVVADADGVGLGEVDGVGLELVVGEPDGVGLELVVGDADELPLGVGPGLDDAVLLERAEGLGDPVLPPPPVARPAEAGAPGTG